MRFRICRFQIDSGEFETAATSLPRSFSLEDIRTPKADGDKLMENIARYTVPVRPGRQDLRDLRVKGFPGFVYRVAA